MNMFAERFLPNYAPEGVASGAAPSGGGSSSPSSGEGGNTSSAPATSASTSAASVPSSPSTSTTPSLSQVESSPQGDDYYTGMSLEDEDGSDSPPSVPDSASAEGTAAPPAAPAPVPPQAAPAEPPAQPQPQPSAVPSQQEPAASASSEPVSLLQQIAEHRDAMISGLAAERFQLSPGEVQELEPSVAAFAPKLAARVYYEAVAATLNHIQNYVPRMIQQFVEVQRLTDEAEKGFYGKFAALDRAKHGKDVQQFGLAFRASNPQIAQDDLWSMIGAAVMAKYGLNAAPSVQPNGSQQTPPATPRVAQTPAFVPAQSGATVRVTPEPENPWSGMGRDFESDD